jgi:nicotinamidase-related amidase
MTEGVQQPSLSFGPLTGATVHLCIDMQAMFWESTAWHVPWMRKVLPVALRIARAFPARTIFTRFVPPARAEDAPGTWRRYYERWPEFTGERLPPRLVSLVPPLLELVPPAKVRDKRFYSPFTDTGLHHDLRRRDIDSLVISGGETDVCVLAAVLDAVDLGYRVVVASDALCSASDEAHDALLQLFNQRFQQQIEVVPADAILATWT